MTAALWVSHRSREAVRYLLAVVCALDVASMVWLAFRSRAGVVPAEAPLPILGWLNEHPPALLPLLAVTLWGLWQFARHHALGPGLVAAVAMGILFEAHVAGFGFIVAESLIPRATFVGWLAGAVTLRASVARLPDPADNDSQRDAAANLGGWHGALAVFAATYVAAGMCKFMRSGLHWTDHRTIDYILLANLPGPGLRLQIDEFILTHQGIGHGLALFTLVIELLAFFALWGPRLRLVACAAILTFHLGLLVTTGLLGAIEDTLALAFALPWPRLIPALRDTAWQDPVLDSSRARRAFRILVAALVLLAAVAWLTDARTLLRLSPRARLQPWAAEK